MNPYPSPYQAPADLGYQSADPQAKSDQSHLQLIAIFHYIWGPLVMLFSCFFIIYIVLGVMMLNNPSMMSRPLRAGSAAAPAPPAGLGWMFIILGSAVVLFGWTVGILNIVSGRAIAKRKWRVFSLVLAGFNCLSVPIGTALGVFTFIVLLRDSVRAEYAARVASGYQQNRY